MIDLKKLYEKEPQCFASRDSLMAALRKASPENEKEAVEILKVYDNGAAEALRGGNALSGDVSAFSPNAVQAWTEVLAAAAGIAEQRETEEERGRQLCREKKYAEAIPVLKRAAEAGSVDAAYRLGEIYSDGKGTAVDMPAAFQYYRQAADAGDAMASFYTAMMLENGEGTAKDPAQAFRYCKKAAEAGEKFARCDLGRMYENGIGTETDYAAAASWYRKAAKQGNPEAAAALERLKTAKLHDETGSGMKDEKDRSDTDPAELVVKGRELAKAGQDSEALTVLKRAARRGSAEAAFLVGQMLENGRGTEKNPSAAHRFYRQAAAEGQVEAAEAAERLKPAGSSEAPKLPIADTAKAKDPGSSKHSSETVRPHRSQESLMLKAEQLYVDGKLERALTSYQTAAARGENAAYRKLAEMYEAGLGTDKDLETAYRFYCLGAENGDPECVQLMDTVHSAAAEADSLQIPGIESSAEEIEIYKNLEELYQKGEGLFEYVLRRREDLLDCSKLWAEGYAADAKSAWEQCGYLTKYKDVAPKLKICGQLKDLAKKKQKYLTEYRKLQDMQKRQSEYEKECQIRRKYMPGAVVLLLLGALNFYLMFFAAGFHAPILTAILGPFLMLVMLFSLEWCAVLFIAVFIVSVVLNVIVFGQGREKSGLEIIFAIPTAYLTLFGEALMFIYSLTDMSGTIKVKEAKLSPPEEVSETERNVSELESWIKPEAARLDRMVQESLDMKKIDAKKAQDKINSRKAKRG